ncbi:DNA fragmentation factor subunit beta [Biomphalaria pfeifferi]|uniref:DNAation factor subunit beta n=1 Tax=Biomphalaria pfeifferi TaxID=112525 RepID=A0AAD8AVC8_BIOPF|nr:DNA fragmentation factor subunit beta [Biomphalaria pfeifferi]
MTASLTLLLGFILYTSAGTQPPDPFFMLLEANNQDVEKAYIGRRPSHSEQLPIEDLIESSDKIYDPRPSDINEKLLRKQLGAKFRSEFLSIRDPEKKMNQRIAFHNGRPVGRRPRFLGLLRSALLQDGSRIELNISKKERRKFQKYLWSLTFCPVVYSWKYLGIRFWPHWIKEGKCLMKRSCSLPEGMTCNPSSSSNIALLRWHCTDYENHNTCQWIRILYPIITECSCSCRADT